MEALDLARGEEIAVEVAPEPLLDVWPQDLHRHLAAHAIVDHDGLVHLRDRRRRNRRSELDEMIFQPAAERVLDRLCALAPWKTAASGPADGEIASTIPAR